MKLLLKREVASPAKDTTIGQLFVVEDGQEPVFFCFTLEDEVRKLGPNGEGKVFGATAIPAGTYDVVVTLSPKFKKQLPRLLNVPFFTGILMHSGNTDADTMGCILVGDEVDLDHFEIVRGTSTPAITRLLHLLDEALEHGPVSIEIQNCLPEED